MSEDLGGAMTDEFVKWFNSRGFIGQSDNDVRAMEHGWNGGRAYQAAIDQSRYDRLREFAGRVANAAYLRGPFLDELAALDAEVKL